MSDPHRYFERLAAAYVRGKLLDAEVRAAHDPLFTRPLDALAEDEPDALIRLGADHGLRLHRFKRFVRLPRDLASSVPGNGLGLYLCQAYVEAMGGNIWVESTGIEGHGSVFHLRLPVAPLTEGQAIVGG